MKLKNWRPLVAHPKMQAASERIELRPYRVADYPAWREAHLRLGRKKNRFDSSPPPARKLTEAGYRRLLNQHKKRSKSRKFFDFGIFDRKTGAHYGHVDLFVFSPDLSWANLGYAVHHHSWGKGYASEAATLALAIGFGSLNLYRIEASCEPANKASAKVAQRAGLMPEGRRRKFFPKDGGIDLLVFGMNAIDHKKRKARRK